MFDCDPIHLDRKVLNLKTSLGVGADNLGTTLLPGSFVIPWEICTQPNVVYYYQKDAIAGYLIWVQYDLVQLIQANGGTGSGDLTVNQWLYFAGTKYSAPSEGRIVAQTFKSQNGFSYSGLAATNASVVDTPVYNIRCPKLVNALSSGINDDILPFNTSTWSFGQGSKWFSAATGDDKIDLYTTTDNSTCSFALVFDSTNRKYSFGYFSKAGSTAKDIDASGGANAKAIYVPNRSLSFAFVQYTQTLTLSMTGATSSAPQGSFEYSASNVTSRTESGLIIDSYTSGGYGDLKRINEDFDSNITALVHPYILANI